jgi:sigma-B regulation protein RsbU (phosphoserine phosphatase)
MARAEDQLARYRILMNTARCFWRAMDQKALVDEILNRSQEVMRAEACTLFLPDFETGELLLHSTDPKLATLPEPLRLPRGKGIAGAVFETRAPINIKDPASDARYYQGIAQKVGFTTRAMLTIPLLEAGNCAGVLQALNPIGRDCFDDEDEEIFEGFGGLIATVLVRLENEKREIEIARSKQELQVAREIQESFLPPAVERFPFCRVLMDYFPASAVGGDFCSVHPVGKDKLLVALGDVTGKGIPASLTMARATAMIKALVPQLREDLGKWVSLLNDQLVQDLQGGRFIGLTFMLADAGAATLHICAAGQFAPVHFDGTTWTEFQTESHLPLGIMPGINYRSTDAPLKAGHSWLLFSDGIPEARNSAGADFTIANVVLGLNQTRPTHSLREFVLRWKEFVGNAQQHDDASLLLLDWRGQSPSASLELVCCAETMGHGREFVEAWATYAGFDDVTIGQIILACDEAATNVFRHAYGNHPGPLSFQAEVNDTHLTLRMTDKAKAVDPSKLAGRALEDLRPGGLGTVIIQKVFDEVVYEPLPAGTTLTLRKNLAL